MDDHQVCAAIRAGKEVRDFRDIQRAWERGLIDLAPTLTRKGVALLDGIEPTLDAYVRYDAIRKKQSDSMKRYWARRKAAEAESVFK